MVTEMRPDYPSEYAAMIAVAQILGIGSPETIRTWIRRSPMMPTASPVSEPTRRRSSG
jgi:hypothetical protein